MPSFELIDKETVFEGRIFDVVRARYRHADGEVVERENVEHGGAVGIVVHDDEDVWLVRQPREGIMRDDVLEIPAGRLDVEGEAPEDAAKRELAEELGLAADHWTHTKTYYTSAGFTNEQIHLYVATGLRQVAKPETEEDERIEIVKWPLADLDGAIDANIDAKTLIGLLLLRRDRG
ncbi:MAG: 8-oxo-dGDP phosphatase [Solirubrobacteraceae bacterium]|jgi:ADP-ribose pyrophosphatase|nr:8-oxo-dGDP phosphatase [Solirubrobacteraceae bacterium]